jgi:hypothetical protein
LEDYQDDVFRFIPLEAHNDFLRPLVGDIQSQLRNLRIIPTEPDGALALPAGTRYASVQFYELLAGSREAYN